MRITSAPLSARYLVVMGATPTHEKSRTFTPSSAKRPISYASLAAQALQASIAQAEQPTVDLGVVLAYPGRASMRSHRSHTELGEGSRHGEPAAQRIVIDLDEIFACLELLVMRNVRDVRARCEQDAPLEGTLVNLPFGHGQEEALDALFEVVDLEMILLGHFHEHAGHPGRPVFLEHPVGSEALFTHPLHEGAGRCAADGPTRYQGRHVAVLAPIDHLAKRAGGPGIYPGATDMVAV